MKDLKKLATEPIFFERNRVFRIYKGGKLYKDFFRDGKDDGLDNLFPEEWVASKVKAINPKYFGKRDGVSVVKGTEIFFDDLLKEFPNELLGNRKYDCLVKFIDSAIRLPFQVHPTKEFSRKHFNSEYVKTEAWLGIDKRPIAKLYFGFKDKMTKEQIDALENASETENDVFSGLLNSVPVNVGDIWLIKAGLVHAIGAGCMIVEVQEPTDFTIQPERWCGDYHLSPNEEYLGLEKSVALDAIDYSIFGESAISYARVNVKKVIDTKTYVKEVLIGYEDTPCFSENRHTISSGGSFVMDFAPSVYICTDGEAVILGDGYQKKIKKGDYFFLPFSAENKFTVVSGLGATLIECLPSKQN